ncbi:MAG: hypothetical protein AAB709_00900 [Patescibacteria group bacterium]
MKSSSTHFILVLAASLLISAGYGIWYAAVSNKSNDVAELQNKITTATETVARIASARAALAEISSDEAKVRSYFVSETEVVAFINNLESRGLAQGAPIQVLSVSTSGSSARPTLLLTLAAQGTFDAIMRTVGAIEYAPYDLTISSLSIEQDAKDAWQATLNLIVGSVPVKAATKTP